MIKERIQIQDLKPYKMSELSCKVKLDANEVNLDLFEERKIIGNESNLNYYPDDDALELRVRLESYLGIDRNNIIVGNGSSEMIELVLKAYIDSDDYVLSLKPSFSMYKIFTQIYGGNFIGAELNENFDVPWEMLKNLGIRKECKVIFLCNPNNPTGKLMDSDKILNLAKSVDAVVVVDEAYIEFSNKSMCKYFRECENIVVIRTFSKAFALAGIRVGYMTASNKVIDVIKKVKSPYNLNTLSQKIASKALEKQDLFRERVEKIKSERKYVFDKLEQLGQLPYESEANFIFFKSNIQKLADKLAKKGVLIRSFCDEFESYYRVSIGNNYENRFFIKKLSEVVCDENRERG